MINGTLWTTGTALDFACVEAGEDLGLGPSGIIPVYQAGTATSGGVTEDGTTFGNTSLIQNSNPNYTNPVWYDFIGGNSENGVTPGTLEDAMNTYLQAVNGYLNQTGNVVNHVAVVNMHNETDESNPNVASQAGLNDWATAIFDRRADIAADFGKSQASVPLALAWVPYNFEIQGGAAASEESGNSYDWQSGALESQYIGNSAEIYNLHAAEQALVDNSEDGMIWAGNFGDASMARYDYVNGQLVYINGGQHFSTIAMDNPYSSYVPNDFQIQPSAGQADFIARMANNIANMFASDAQPGSQFANDGDHADMGPVAQSATIAGGYNVLVTFSMDPTPGAGSFDALSPLAGLGSGWTLNNVSNPTQIDNYATSAQIWGTNQIMLTFVDPVSTSDSLFYEGIGDGHIRVKTQLAT